MQFVPRYLWKDIKWIEQIKDCQNKINRLIVATQLKYVTLADSSGMLQNVHSLLNFKRSEKIKRKEYCYLTTELACVVMNFSFPRDHAKRARLQEAAHICKYRRLHIRSFLNIVIKVINLKRLEDEGGGGAGLI